MKRVIMPVLMKSSIKIKILILVIVMLIPLILLQYNSIKRIFHAQVDSHYLTYQSVAEAISVSFVNYLHELWTQETIIGAFILAHPDLKHAEIQGYLVEAQKRQKTLVTLSWIEPDGTIAASSNTEFIGASVRDRSYYKRIVEGEDNVLSELVISKVTGEPIIPVVSAVRKDGELIGIVSAVVDIERLALRLPSPFLHPKVRYGLIDVSGTVVYKSDNNNIPMEKRKVPLDNPTWMALKGEAVRITNLKSMVGDPPRIGVIYPIREIGWACQVSSSYKEVMDNQLGSLKRDLFILAVIVLFSLLGAFLLAYSILIPLKKMRVAANAIKTGDYSARTLVEGYDELAVTAQTFDIMAENIEQHDKMKTQFFTNLSHELRTPLNVVLASTQLINAVKGSEDCPAHGKVKSQVGIIRQNCYRLIRMINNLIDISKHDMGFLNIKPGNYNIVKLVEDITLSVVRYAETKGIEVLFDTDIEEMVTACDPDAVERVMLNLLSNALKFTKSKGRITVSLCDKGDNIEISVKDTGIGIPKDKLDIIFERFGQVDTSLSRNHEGSGIGLSLVKTLIEAHKGAITVESEIDKGTEFIIKFPVSILPEEKLDDGSNDSRQVLVEKINIEFSDIYELRNE